MRVEFIKVESYSEPSGTSGYEVAVAKAHKAAAEASLEALAQAYAATHRVSVAKAYTAILSTPAGSHLYAAACAAHRAFQTALAGRSVVT